MRIYADTSILTAYYVNEAGSENAQTILQTASAVLLSDLSALELSSALSRKIREREISRESATQVLETFTAHILSGVFQKIALLPSHYIVATTLIRRFDNALRSLDALHLAVSMSEELLLVTADRRLHESAVKIGQHSRLING